MSLIMGKEEAFEGLEFDGDTVLCRVCADRASGFHYGVHACEGCKGFFRRSIQQKIQYRACLNNQQCSIVRGSRNRCQYCRLKKCIAVGMSRDAVRFGRVPKKEKARIIEQMQKSNLQNIAPAFTSALSSEDLIQSVITAHQQTCEMGLDKIRILRETALHQNDFLDCPAHMACPLNTHASSELNDNQDWTDFSEFFAPAIKSIVDFARLIPGFLLLNQDDQVNLLKASTFEVLLVRMASLFDADTNTMMFVNGKLYRRQTSGLSTSAGLLLDSMFDFAECFNKLNLTEDEIALFCGVVLLSPDCPGLRQVEQVEKIQNKLMESLQNMINLNHKEDSTLFAKLLMKTTDLRTLNALHAEKTLCSTDRGDDGDILYPDDRSEASTITGSLSSLATYASTSTMDMSQYDSTGSLNRYSSDGSQPVVLKTPYGTFYREDTGYYGMLPDQQPRSRRHTLDRDSQITRPRLHTIEEGSKRRYTMDREYMTKIVGKLNDRIEKRNQVNSMPASVCNSTASSPVAIFEEQYSYVNQSHRDFIPISTSDSSAGNSCTSPSFHKDTLQTFASSPNSPGPRSDSIGQEDFGPMRPRCASFHVNSEGHTAQGHQYKLEPEYLSQDIKHCRMSSDMRRGSIGASNNLHAWKKSLLIDRNPTYLAQVPDAFCRKAEKQRSLLATQNSVKGHLGSKSSAFEHVSCVSMPAINWTLSTGQPELYEPPKVSVTRPVEDMLTSSNDYLGNAETCTNLSSVNSLRRSPEHVLTSEELYHKKFDKLRKHQIPSSYDNANNMEKLTIHDGEYMELDNNHAMIDNELATCENDSIINGAKLKKSTRESHPQILAQLKSGLQYQTSLHPFASSSVSQNGLGAIIKVNSGHDAGQSRGNLSPNNVVPHTLYVNRSSGDTSQCNGSISMTSTHPCLQNLLNRNDANCCNMETFLKADNSCSNTQEQKHVIGKSASLDNLHKQDAYHHSLDNNRNGHSSQQHVYEEIRAQQEMEPQSLQHQYFLYQQMCIQQQQQQQQQQQGVRLTHYNEHLVGMQQMVYGHPELLRRCSAGDIPSNLTQNSTCNDDSDGKNSELVKKVKEVIS